MTTMPSAEPVRVLFISGWGRSGSTLLDRLLGAVMGFCPVGELRDVFLRGPVQDARCGCGERFSACPFWTAVGTVAFGGWDQVDAEGLAADRLRLDRPWHLLPLLTPAARTPAYSARHRRYTDALARLYTAIGSVSGAPVVAESTKIATHALLLREVDGLDLRTLHLVRDPRGVAYSWQKQASAQPAADGDSLPRYSTPAAAVRYSLYNSLARMLPFAGVPYVRVRYEDLVQEPVLTMTAVARHAWDLPLGDIGQLADGRATFGTDHPLDANPMRFQSSVTLRLDEEWRQAMPAGRRRAIEMLTTPLRAAYGYTTRAAPAARQPAAAGAPAGEQDTVTVVVATRDRPALLRRTLDAIFTQTYPGPVDVLVVYDQSEPEAALAGDYAGKPLTVITNDRTPGLAGARNTGTLAATGDWVAFCDDDDEWLPDKLARQLARAAQTPSAQVVVTGILVDYEGKLHRRVPGRDALDFRALLRSRVMEAHPSTVLVRKSALLGDIGLVDEHIPGSYGEDYEWMLRATKVTDVAVVDAPLCRVRWHTGSFFADRWRTLIRSIDYLIARFPEFQTEPRGLARLNGRKAFAYAAAGDRRAARAHAVKAFKLNWREQRAYVGLLLGLGVISPERVIAMAHRRGRGV